MRTGGGWQEWSVPYRERSVINAQGRSHSPFKVLEVILSIAESFKVSE